MSAHDLGYDHGNGPVPPKKIIADQSRLSAQQRPPHRADLLCVKNDGEGYRWIQSVALPRGKGFFGTLSAEIAWVRSCA